MTICSASHQDEDGKEDARLLSKQKAKLFSVFADSFLLEALDCTP